MESSLAPLRLPATSVARALAVCALALCAAAQSVPDQVFVRKAGSSAVSIVSGTVTEDGRERVTVDVRGKEQKVPAADVERIAWGEVPPDYKEGVTFLDRGDHENAVARFRVAATDASTRDVVQASARLLAAEALLGWGTKAPEHFREAALEAERYVQAYPEARELPRARMLRARATWLSGDPAAAGAQYRALWEESLAAQSETGFRAGLMAARALLAAGDTLAAREIYTRLDTDLTALGAGPDGGGGVPKALEAIQAEARLGEGFVLAASDQGRQAVAFFEGRLGDPASTLATARSALALGYALSLLAEERPLAAQVWFAKVTALEPTDRDRIAAALVGMARCARASEKKAENLDAGVWLAEVVAHYGDTPAATVARELK
jgi:hypothetical protein